MVKNVDFSNVLEWVDKPVWVVTKIRKKVREEDEFTKRLRRSSVFIPVLYEKL